MVGRGHVAGGIQAGGSHRQNLAGRYAAVVNAPGAVDQVADVQDVEGQLDLAAVLAVVQEILGELEVEMMLEWGLRGETLGPLATVGGQAFGDPDCIRMSYATSDQNIVEAMRRIREALALLK